jgi:hypothetical protein
MYLCYIDESGTPDVPGNSSHFVLAGLTVPIWHWRAADAEISGVLNNFGLANEELHTAWLLRKYIEQSQIPDFDRLSWPERRSAVLRKRNGHLLKLQQSQNRSAYNQTKKNYTKTLPYIHLTFDQRVQLIQTVAQKVSRWGFARLFAECIDKLHFDPAKTSRTIEQQAFEQVVSRFEQYLKREVGSPFGLLVHDNNPTVAKRHTALMRQFHLSGTLWTSIERIIETPLFVDSQLTRMVQIADLCSYALRQYVEKNDTSLSKHVFARAHRLGNTSVGVRHYTILSCVCGICKSHRGP